MTTRRRNEHNFVLYFFISFSVTLLFALVISNFKLKDLQDTAIKKGYAGYVNGRFEWKPKIY
jgi:hypothetical protein